MLLFTVLFVASIQSAFLEVLPTADSGHAQNCKELLDEGVTASGVYTIQTKSSPEPFQVYCNMQTEDGGWAYILNRVDGTHNFSQLWHDYQTGFGNIAHEHWLGLDHIHELTGDEINELLVELIDWDLNVYRIHYDAFSVAGENQDYTLAVVDGYSGDLGDSLTYHAGHKFGTVDHRNDEDPTRICAEFCGGGGWWYYECRTSLLTGLYLDEEEATHGENVGCIYWSGMQDVVTDVTFYGFKAARMMVRPKSVKET